MPDILGAVPISSLTLPLERPWFRVHEGDFIVHIYFLPFSVLIIKQNRIRLHIILWIGSPGVWWTLVNVIENHSLRIFLIVQNVLSSELSPGQQNRKMNKTVLLLWDLRFIILKLHRSYIFSCFIPHWENGSAGLNDKINIMRALESLGIIRQIALKFHLLLIMCISNGRSDTENLYTTLLLL